jgi:SPP1 gp7 family putative phage head morphogenesis protein
VSQPWNQLPFEGAIEYFRDKRNVDTDSWRDIQGTEYDAAFAVAGAKGALLQDMREAVDKAISQGTTLQEFRKDFNRIVQTRGWDYAGDRDWRTYAIYDTNLRSAYAAGRWEQIQEGKASRPYLQWRHGGSRDPRPLHLALDKQVFRVDDPFWQTMGNPPIGFGCRCQVFALKQRDVDRLGLSVIDGPEMGAVFKYSIVQPDPGWGGGHRRSTPETRAARLKQITDRLHPSIAASVTAEVKEFMRSQPPVKATAEDFDQTKEWPAEYDRLLERPNLNDSEKSKLSDGKWVLSEIVENLIATPNDADWLRGLIDGTRVGLLDRGGLLQSVALVVDAQNRMEIAYITIAPWNLAKSAGDPRQVENAGKALIAQIAQESIDRGYDGRIRLTALNPKPYERLGFVEIDNGEIRYMELPPKAAKALIESAKTINFDEGNESDDGLLILSPRPRPADYDPLAPTKQALSLQDLRLKREADKAPKPA